MTETRPGIAIIGGGIVGASVAYHLSTRTTEPITVYERSELASETTFKSTAMIGPAGPDPYREMKAYGFRLYNDFFADPMATPQYRQSGRLRVTTEPDTAKRFERLAGDDADQPDASGSVDISTARFAHDVLDYVPGDELRETFLLPSLDTEIIEGALYRPQYGHIQSDSRTLGARALAFEFIERARDNGVTFETNTEVTDIITVDGAVTGIKIGGDSTVEIDTVVCAAGPWNPRLAERAGIEVPVEQTLSPVFALERSDPVPYTMPMIKSHESSVGLHPKREDTILVTYTPDEAGSGPRIDPGATGEKTVATYRETALEWAERLLPRLGDAELVDEWVGVGTYPPDRNPIAGWTSIEGLSLAITPAGIQFAPAVGRIIAHQIVAGEPTEYYEAVSISRFDGYTDGYTR